MPPPFPQGDNDEYLVKLRAFLRPLEGTSYYTGSWYDRTDTAHFDNYIDLSERFTPIRGAVVLDAGTGTGGMLVAALRRGAGRCLGVEVDASNHDLATTRLRGTGCEIELTDGECLPWPDNTVDVAFSVHVIEHVRDPEVYLRELARVLKPGGTLVLSCPNRMVPREVHAEIPYVTWLPVALARRLCAWRSRASGTDTPIGLQYNIVPQVNHFLSYFDLRGLWRSAGLAVMHVNPPNRCVVLASDLGAWGAAHPLLSVPFRLINNGVMRRILVPAVRRWPTGRLAIWGSLLISWEHVVVLRKP